MVRSSPSYKCVQNFDVSAGSTLTGYNKCKAQQVKSSTKIEEVWGAEKKQRHLSINRTKDFSSNY